MSASAHLIFCSHILTQTFLAVSIGDFIDFSNSPSFHLTALFVIKVFITVDFRSARCSGVRFSFQGTALSAVSAAKSNTFDIVSGTALMYGV